MIEIRSDLAAFFHEHLIAAQEDLAVDVPEEAEHYVVRLLVRIAEPAADSMLHVPLVLQWRDALEEPHDERRFRRFREMGDSALVRRGVFPEEHEARGIHASYLGGVGRHAYAEAARVAPTPYRRAGVFDALAESFEPIVRVMLDVQERVRDDESDVARLAMAVRRGDSVAAARKLASQGLIVGAEVEETN